VISKALTRDSKLLNSYQQKFFDFSLKFGWLVLSLSIGLGAYWAKIALTSEGWGRYWGWDPVETVSLVPWFFVSAYFHTKIFQKKNPLLVKINVVLIFLSIIFSTLIVRGGGLSSLHAFAGATELVVWVAILGLILVIGSLYIIYIMLDYVFEEYRNPKLFFDYLSYIFLISLAFVCIFGLLIPPITHLLSNYFAIINVIFIRTDYFILSTLVLASGLAVSLIFCSLWEYFSIKWISIIISIALVFQSIISYYVLFIFDIGINPLIIIFFIAIFATLFKLIKNFNVKKGAKYFFRLNSKTIIHTGIASILVGFLILPSLGIFQDIFFISGFILLMIGIIPSILISLLPSKSKIPKEEVARLKKLKELEIQGKS
jgi:cytochrome c biogenesis factor